MWTTRRRWPPIRVTGLGDTPAWELDDDPGNTFALQGTGPMRTLHFRQPPDFETLFATREDTVYTMTLRAHADQVTVTQQVAVTLRNVEEAGAVSLSSLAPERGQELTAEVADPDGVLPATTVWTWEADGEAVHTDSGGATSRYTPSLSDVGRELQVRVAYRDRHGPDKRAVSASTAAVVGPELDGPESLTFVEHGTFVDENGEEVEPTYTVSGVDGTATWSLSGADAAAFDLAAASGGASLSFSETELPNFEAPTDTDLGGPNTYHVTVVATLTDGASEPVEDSFANLFAAFQSVSDEEESAQASSSSLTQAVVVTVENGDDEGAVALPSTARVGQSLTAALVDEDADLTDMVWTWLADGDDMRTASGDTTDSYEPQSADEGRRLQAQVRYEDTFGAKTIESALTAAVQPAGVVELSPPQPRVGAPVTATLRGPEEPVTGAAWSWWRRQEETEAWQFIGGTPSSSLAGLYGSFHWGSKGNRSGRRPRPSGSTPHRRSSRAVRCCRSPKTQEARWPPTRLPTRKAIPSVGDGPARMRGALPWRTGTVAQGDPAWTN